LINSGMTNRGCLVLEDGAVFPGTLLQPARASGEVVFNTGMTGYQEVLTDPSYCGQIVVMTYPLIGNYGVTAAFDQARRSYVRGFVIGELCLRPSNWQSEGSLGQYLTERKIPCLTGVDTRALTRHLRSRGTMQGRIITDWSTWNDYSGSKEEAELDTAQCTPGAASGPARLVEEVTTPEIYRLPNSGFRLVVMDFGIKKNILNSMSRKGFDLTVVPATTPASEVLKLNPDGVFLSNGPGDPKEVGYAIAAVREIITQKPVFGICLGHQLLALALGGDTYKLKFGHRGANHPVKDLATGRVYITSQNHGYAVDAASIADKGLVVTHRAVNDGTVEGMRHRTLPVFSVQYHPEAAPGPDDNTYLFDVFSDILASAAGGR